MSDNLDALRRRRYEDPPVVEAIARLQWSSPIPWSFTTPGLLFERLRDAYPEEPKAHAVVRAEVMAADAPAPGDPGNNAGFQLSAGAQRVLFSQEAGTRLLGIGPTDISAHGLPPYEGWESLERRLIEGCGQILSIVGEDATVSVVAVRYVNRIELASPDVELDDYLTIRVGLPPEYPSYVTAFLHRMEMEYLGEGVKLAFTWASTDAPEGHSAFIIDLDLVATLESPVRVIDAVPVLKDLKVKEGRAFEGLLKDRLREQFSEVG